jgi:2-polyprenyl-6-methoxyphenol hydroxylase-like FAD-dependent oxidoreductase
MMGILPVRKCDGKYEAALYWSMKSTDLEKLESDNFSAIKEEILQFWPDTPCSLEPLDFDDFVSTNYNDIWTPKPFRNRLFAIGNVSHATSPQLGQGCTMALVDAWSLAKSINTEDEDLARSLAVW